MLADADNPTGWLQAATKGDSPSLQRLFTAVYDELHNLATARMRQEKPGHTLQPTAIVNEVYLRLVDQRNTNWTDRAHFMAIASEAMWRVIRDYGRHRHRQKRGGGFGRVTLEDQAAAPDTDAEEAHALSECLERLMHLHERQARVAMMKWFAGMKVHEIARVLSISDRQVEADWAMAKAWLKRELTKDA